jgi:hypothetical protein
LVRSRCPSRRTRSLTHFQKIILKVEMY